MVTQILIRACIGSKWESVDIGDPKLSADQLLRWMASKDDEYILQVIKIARETILYGDKE